MVNHQTTPKPFDNPPPIRQRKRHNIRSNLRLRLAGQGIGHGRAFYFAAVGQFAFSTMALMSLLAQWHFLRRQLGKMTAYLLSLNWLKNGVFR